MTVHLKPEDEQLIKKRLESGAFADAEDVIHRALESLDSDEVWLAENRAAIREQIDTGFAQCERGEGLSPAESLATLEAKKSTWRANQRRA
jgi:putative addiction module CopG family antidote